MSNYTSICPECKETRSLKTKPKIENGVCKSCTLKLRNTSHGMSDSRIYNIWKDMKKRCNNSNHMMYQYYGGIGISYWAGWEHFESFYEWAIENGYSEELELDRIDVDLDYGFNNCRWVDRVTQMQNTRKIWSHNTSGYRGVHLRKPKNKNQKEKWYAQISVNNNKIGLGSYNTAEEAAMAYDTYVINNCLNHTINGVMPNVEYTAL